MDIHLRANSNECRPAQLFGAWACEPSYLRSFVEQARSADLASLRAERREMLAAAQSAQSAAGGLSQDPYSIVDGVAVIELSGPLTKYPTSFQSLFGGTSTLQTRAALRTAARDTRVRAVMVLADTPGGTHAGTGDLAAAIRSVAAVKPVHTYAEDLAASAGLWAIAAGSHVTANASAIIGSIGVYSVVHDTSTAYEQKGVEVYVVSSAPPIKGAGVDGSKILPEQLADLKRRVDDMAGVFVSDVARLRGLSLSHVQSLATGQVWGAAEALDKKLIDGIGSIEDAIASVLKESPRMSNQIAVPAATSESAVEAVAAADPIAAPIADTVTVTRAELQALQAQAEQAKTLLAADRARTFQALAKDLGLPDGLAEVLDRVEASASAEDFGALAEAFRAKSAQIKSAGLFEAKGTGDPAAAADADPTAQIEAIAGHLLEEGKAKTRAQAVSLAAKQNPELYKAHMATSRTRSTTR